jgi:hypothetical protein
MRLPGSLSPKVRKVPADKQHADIPVPRARGAQVPGQLGGPAATPAATQLRSRNTGAVQKHDPEGFSYQYALKVFELKNVFVIIT